MRFDTDVLALLAESEEIDIETVAPDGPPHRTTIWLVVDGDDVFIRSVNGARARWYREATADPAVTIHVGRRQVAATAIEATDPTSIRRTSDGLARKYGNDPALASMVKPDILDTTLRLEPS